MSTGLVIPSYAMGFARNAAEAAYPELWRGLVGCWCPFLGPGGLVLRDISGHHNHGTLTNMDPATDWAPTPYGWGLDFDGINDWITCGSTVLSTPATFSCFIVVRTDTTDSIKYFFDSSNGAIGFGLRTSGTAGTLDFFSYRTGGLSLMTGVGSISVGEWMTLFGVQYTDHNELYKNGLSIGTNADAVGALVAGDNLGLAADFSGWAALASQVAAAAIWSRAPSAAEIRLLAADPHAIARVPRPAIWAPQRAGVRVLAAYDRDGEVGEATSLQLYSNDGGGGAMDWDNAIGSASLATALKHQVVEIESSELWHGRTYNVGVRARTAGGTESDNTDTTEVTGDGVGPGTPTLQTDIV